VYTETAIIEVEASPEQVWQVLSDLRRLPEWYVPSQAIDVLSDGPIQPGWQFDLSVRTLAGIVLSAIGTVKIFDPDRRRIVWRGRATGIEGDSRWEVLSGPQTGQAQIRHTFAGRGWLFFLSYKLGRNALTLQGRLANLKALIEHEVQQL
jgi:hypothetical protein